jgi:hypothetical protein
MIMLHEMTGMFDLIIAAITALNKWLDKWAYGWDSDERKRNINQEIIRTDIVDKKRVT